MLGTMTSTLTTATSLYSEYDDGAGTSILEIELPAIFLNESLFIELNENQTMSSASDAMDRNGTTNNNITLKMEMERRAADERASVEFWLLVKMIVMAIVLGLMILVTIIGNVFVIAAIILERNLQNVANYLVASLAVADLFVACLVMPLGAVYEISNGWILGPELCDIWTSCDVLCCTASILHLVAIAADRYWTVTNIDYNNLRTPRRVFSMIFCVWFSALIVSLAPQFGWKDPDYLKRIEEQHCMVSQDVAYQIFATCCTFYVPLLVILFLYWKIYIIARKRIQRRTQKSFNVTLTETECDSSARELQKEQRKRRVVERSEEDAAAGGQVHRRTRKRIRICFGRECSNSTTGRTSNANEIMTLSHQVSSGTQQHLIASHLNAITPLAQSIAMSGGVDGGGSSPGAGGGGKGVLASIANPHQKLAKRRQLLEAKRERKAAQTLAIITGAFVVCWLPFFVMALTMSLCKSCYIHPAVASLFLWLGYFNSTLNPIIYTIFNPEFRRAFQRILYGRKHMARARSAKI
ncbi:5-hydroxytryptamine receptor 2B [Scaptodrosophila lebanonensis]|uniref:5-hydroxytryptamine receptor 2B n=1 Tax=Drosophila lebanonensis TaxID=7225 RepID=A0A6J2TR25_DROLE|nr:5-hydroxytryptamine receptor 2B [Scaptodrosophila lebanonensis]